MWRDTYAQQRTHYAYYMMKKVDYWSKKLCKAFLFHVATRKEVIIPNNICNEVMLFFFQEEAMDIEYAERKCFRIYRNQKTAETINGMLTLTEQNDILCNNYINAADDNECIHEWQFYIHTIPKGKEKGLHFNIAMLHTDHVDFKWWPVKQEAHRFKHFKNGDFINITIDWTNEECIAYMRINGVVDGPEYDLDQEALKYDYYTKMTVGWGSRDPGIKIELINYRPHLDYWDNF